MLIISFILEQISYATVPELIATGFMLPLFFFDIYLLIKD